MTDTTIAEIRKRVTEGTMTASDIRKGVDGAMLVSFRFVQALPSGEYQIGAAKQFLLKCEQLPRRSVET